MKSNYSSKPSHQSTSVSPFSLSGFSHRLARPSVGLTVTSLTASRRRSDLWDESFLDRLNPPLTRRHY